MITGRRVRLEKMIKMIKRGPRMAPGKVRRRGLYSLSPVSIVILFS